MKEKGVRLPLRSQWAVTESIKRGLRDIVEVQFERPTSELDSETYEHALTLIKKAVAYVLSFNVQKIAGEIFAACGFTFRFDYCVQMVGRYATWVAYGFKIHPDIFTNDRMTFTFASGVGVQNAHTYPEFARKLVRILTGRLGGVN